MFSQLANKMKKVHPGNSSKFHTAVQEIGEPEKQQEARQILPADSELNSAFENVIMDMELSPEKLSEMRQLSNDKKWLVVTQHNAKMSENIDSQAEKSIQKMIAGINILRAEMGTVEILNTLNQVEVSLRTDPVAWVNAFIQLGGCKLLLNLLEIIHHRSDNGNQGDEQIDLLHSAIRTMKAIMNTARGLREVLNSSAGLNLIALCLECQDTKSKTSVVQMLLAVSLLSQSGYQKVLDAMSHYAESKSEPRFETILVDLNESDTEYNIAAFALINVLINSSPELPLREIIRSEFVDLGLEKKIEKLKLREVKDYVTQLNLFDNCAVQDRQEFIHSSKNLNASDIRDDILRSFQETLSDEESLEAFLFIIRELSILPLNSKRTEFFYLIGSFIKEVALNSLYSFESNSVIMNVQEWIKSIDGKLELKEAKEAAEAAKMEANTFKERSNDFQKIIVKLKEKNEEMQNELKAFSKRNEHRNETESKSVQTFGVEDSVTHRIEPQPDSLGFSINLSNVIIPDFVTIDVVNKLQEYVNRCMLERLFVFPTRASEPAIEEEPDGKGRKRTGSRIRKSFSRMAKKVIPPPPNSATDSSIPSTSMKSLKLQTPTPPTGPPPPPPPNLICDQAVKKKIKPRNKMKQLVWTKVQSGFLPGSLWNSIGIDDEEKIREAADLDEFEDLFGAKTLTPAATPISPLSPSWNSSNRDVSIIDPKRSYNISIMLSRIKLSFTEIKEAILRVDTSIVNEEMLKQFLSFIPTAEDREILEDYENPINLGKAERFFIEMLKIPRYEQRLNAITFRCKYSEKFAEVKRQRDLLINACKEIKQSKKLVEYMKIILSLGNYMNGETFRGGAFGFSVETLATLSETKSSHGNMNFLQYVVKFVSNRYPHLGNLDKELSTVEKASKISLTNFDQEIAELLKGVSQIEKELPYHSATTHTSDKFYQVFSRFVKTNEESFKEIDTYKGIVHDELSKAYEYFGENPKDMTSEKYFGAIWGFCESLEKSKEELKKLEELSKSAVALKNNPSMPQNGERGMMDDLISSLKAGVQLKKVHQ